MVAPRYAILELRFLILADRQDDRLVDAMTEESPIGLDNLITLVQQGFRGSLSRRSEGWPTERGDDSMRNR
jgi:hypothetical protein